MYACVPKARGMIFAHVCLLLRVWHSKRQKNDSQSGAILHTSPGPDANYDDMLSSSRKGERANRSIIYCVIADIATTQTNSDV